MGAYLQFGHASWNLLEKEEIGPHSGVILSPVNDAPATVADRLQRLKTRREKFEFVLEPQLYNPESKRGELAQWSYFPADLETADWGNLAWWEAIGRGVSDDAARLKLNAVCTPVFLPRGNFSDDYYRFIVDIGRGTDKYSRGVGLSALMTATVPLKDLRDPQRATAIASILSSTSCSRIYLAFLDEEHTQRHPLSDEGALAGAMHLVSLLSAEMRVHVAFNSFDALLWKIAGASDVSTGKYMNLRRFSPSRWEEAEDGGGQPVPYWSDDDLLTLLRDQDVLGLRRGGWFAQRDLAANPVAAQILQTLDSGRPWVADSWVQYLRWASNLDAAINTPAAGLAKLHRASNEWELARKLRPRFADQFNDGSHVRNWLNAAEDALRRSAKGT